MRTKTLNPEIDKLEKSHRERRINLCDLENVRIDDLKVCVWCLGFLKGKKYRWCSKQCSDSAFAWANPQSTYGLNVLLARQDWQCNICLFSWKDLALRIHGELYRHYEKYKKATPEFGANFDFRLTRRLKYSCDLGVKPEVDHIVPISKGGLAIGHENHQAVCAQCHKKKTKVDNSGPRKKKL